MQIKVDNSQFLTEYVPAILHLYKRKQDTDNGIWALYQSEYFFSRHQNIKAQHICCMVLSGMKQFKGT